MSYMKRLIEDVMQLYEKGIPIAEIAERLRTDRETVEAIVEEHSNFFD